MEEDLIYIEYKFKQLIKKTKNKIYL